MKKHWLVLVVVLIVVVAVIFYVKTQGVPNIFMGAQTNPQLTVIPGGVSSAAVDNISQTLTHYAATSGKNKAT